MPRDLPPATLVTATTAALRDLVNSGNGVNISYEPSDASSDAWIVMLNFADGSRTGFEVVSCQGMGTLGAAVADGLQQGLIDYLQTAVPRCPSHEHPLVAEEIEGVAVWSCPRSGETWPIGSLDTQ